MEKKTIQVPFDYEKAKANPNLVVNSGGFKPIYIYFGERYIGAVYSDGCAASYFTDGSTRFKDDGFKLMLEETIEINSSYTVVYKDSCTGLDHHNMDQAILYSNSNAVAVLKITVNGKQVETEVVHTF